MYAKKNVNVPKMAGGGGIHINPANKGKFTASANKAGMGVQAFASKVLANKEDYSSTQVKRANFARNASKWKHADGGLIQELTPHDQAVQGTRLPYAKRNIAPSALLDAGAGVASLIPGGQTVGAVMGVAGSVL